MAQTFKQLQLNINQGAPATAVPRSWFLFVNNVLKYLTIRNGKLLTNNDKWTIECASLPPFAFGVLSLNQSSKELEINEGLVSFPTARIYVPKTTITISGSPAFVVLKVNRTGTPAAEWLSSTVSSVPANTPQHIYEPYYEYRTSPASNDHFLYLVHRAGSYTI